MVVKNGKEQLEALAPGTQTEEHLMRQANYLRFWSAAAMGIISVACLVSFQASRTIQAAVPMVTQAELEGRLQ